MSYLTDLLPTPTEEDILRYNTREMVAIAADQMVSVAYTGVKVPITYNGNDFELYLNYQVQRPVLDVYYRRSEGWYLLDIDTCPVEDLTTIRDFLTSITNEGE